MKVTFCVCIYLRCLNFRLTWCRSSSASWRSTSRLCGTSSSTIQVGIIAHCSAGSLAKTKVAKKSKGPCLRLVRIIRSGKMAELYVKVYIVPGSRHIVLDKSSVELTATM